MKQLLALAVALLVAVVGSNPYRLLASRQSAQHSHQCNLDSHPLQGRRSQW